MNWRHWVLLLSTLLVVSSIFLLPPIPQSEAYHDFADQRALVGVPNFLNVASNGLFLVVGLAGIQFVSRQFFAGRCRFIDPIECWPYLLFFFGVAMTAFGSSYYHLHPDDERLVWDRLPMTIGFMSLLAAMVEERISVKWGVGSLFLFIPLGVSSVLYWSYTQQASRGDLRGYVVVQFGSLIAILLLIALFPPRYTRGSDLIASLTMYAAAKGLEGSDRIIYSWHQFVSGHTLKHIAAAISAYWIFHMLKNRTPIAKSVS